MLVVIHWNWKLHEQLVFLVQMEQIVQVRHYILVIFGGRVDKLVEHQHQQNGLDDGFVSDQIIVFIIIKLML